MADEEYKPSGEDEYDFAELGDSDIFGGGEGGADKKQMIMRLVLFVVGVAFIIFVAYKFMGMFLTKKTIRDVVTTKPTPTQQAVPSIPITQPTEAAKRASIEQLTRAVTPVRSSAMAKQLSDRQASHAAQVRELAKQVTASRVNVGSIKTGIDDVKTTLTDLKKQLLKMNSAINMLSNEVMKQRRLIKRMSAKQRAKRAKRRGPRRPSYHLRAVFPGGDSPRAWLIGPKGEVLTVKEGDEIPGHGRVRRIDPDRGQILTSKDAIITYSAADR